MSEKLSASNLIRKLLKTNPGAGTAEINRYVFKHQGKPDWKTMPYKVSGTLIRKVRDEFGILTTRHRKSVPVNKYTTKREIIKECLEKFPHATGLEVSQYAMKKGFANGVFSGEVSAVRTAMGISTKYTISTNSLHVFVEKLITENPNISNIDIGIAAQKAGFKQSSVYAAVKIRKKLGIVGGQNKTKKSNLYYRLTSIPVDKMGSEAKKALVDFVQVLNETGRISLEIIELANPQVMEVRETEHAKQSY